MIMLIKTSYFQFWLKRGLIENRSVGLDDAYQQHVSLVNVNDTPSFFPKL